MRGGHGIVQLNALSKEGWSQVGKPRSYLHSFAGGAGWALLPLAKGTGACGAATRSKCATVRRRHSGYLLHLLGEGWGHYTVRLNGLDSGCEVLTRKFSLCLRFLVQPACMHH